MAKIDVDVKLKDAEGKEIGKSVRCLVLKDDKSFLKAPNGEPTVVEIEDKKIAKTLGDAICESLLVETAAKPLTKEEKRIRYRLWLTISSAEGEIDILTEDIVKIKDCLGETQPILIFGQCEKLIEG